jgi:hypothetical protein
LKLKIPFCFIILTVKKMLRLSSRQIQSHRQGNTNNGLKRDPEDDIQNILRGRKETIPKYKQ